MKGNLLKGDGAVPGNPRSLAPPRLLSIEKDNPIARLIENDELLKRYSEEALRIITEYHNAKRDELNRSAEAEAGTLLRKAKAAAAAILIKSREEAESLRLTATRKAEAAAKEKTDEILEAAREEVVSTFRDGLTALENAAVQVKESKISHIETIECEMAKLVGSLARRLLYRDLSANPDFILDLVKKSLKHFEAGARVIVKLSPKHHKLLTEDPLFAESVRELGLGEGLLELVPDAGISSGGVIVTDRFVTFDYNFDRIIDEMIIEVERNLTGDEPPPSDGDDE